MADSSMFQKTIKIVLDGVDEIKGAEANTDQWAEAIDRVSKAIVDLERQAARLGSGAGQGAQKLSEQMEEVRRRALEARKALKELVEEDISKGGKGDPTGLVKKLDEADIRAAQQWKNYSTANVVSANEQAEKSIERINAAYDRMHDAGEKAKRALPQPGESRLATAERTQKEAVEDLAQARQHLAQVQASGTASEAQHIGAVDGVTAALERQTQANVQLEREAGNVINTLPRLRYALYDVSRTLAQLGGAAFGAASAVGVVATKMNRDFADVIRTTETFRDTTGQSVQALRRNFEDLYTSMPADWGDITRIGEMAGQMNVAANDVAHFSELVTKFAASTDVSVDASAMAFGRLSELLNVSADEYENLGSSILSVGVNSVATESQIIEISQQIAGIGGTAGLTADQVIGLSSALASIGTAPELSRGIVTRFFTNLMSATAEGGERLQKFAAVSGVTAEQFKKAWETDAAGAFQSLIQGLGQVEQSDAIRVLNELGIKQVRDIPAVLKLSQNYELLARSMDIAADGYREGTALADHYGVIAEEVSSKLHVLKNQFSLLLEALGAFTQTDFMKAVIDQVTRALELLTALANNDIGKWVVGFTVAVTGAVGALALLGAGIVSVTASHAGLKTALAGILFLMDNTRSMTTLVNRNVRSLGKELLTSAAAARVLSAALKGLGVGVGIAALTYGLSKWAEQAEKSKRAIEGMRSALSGMGDAFAADTRAFEETGFAISEIDVSFQALQQRLDPAELAFRKITGSVEGTKDSLYGVAGAAEVATLKIGREVVMSLTQAMLANDDFKDSLRGGAQELESYGFNLSDFITKMVSDSGAEEYLDRLDAKLKAAKEEYAAGMVGADPNSVVAALKVTFGGAEEALESLRQQMNAYNGEVDDVVLNQTVMKAVSEELGISMEELEDKFDAAGESAKGFRSILEDFDTSAYTAQDAFYGLAEAVIKNGNVFDEFSVEGRANVKALESALDSLWNISGEDAGVFAANVADAFAYVEGAGYNLTESIDVLDQVLDAAFGTEWRAHLDTTQAHQSIQSYLQAVIAALEARAQLEREGEAMAMASARSTSSLQGAIHYAEQAAVHRENANAVAQQIREVQGLAKGLAQAGTAGKTAGRQIRDGLSGGRGGRGGGSPAKKAAKDARELAKELYTLKDYASDLAEVWSRAFDIRFSGQQTIDSVTTSVRGIAERFYDAAQRVKDLRIQLQSLNADLTGLQAELSKQQYFLSIAVEYGDTARAEQIQARIVELQAEIASKQNDVSKTSKDLTKAQDETSRALTGNSDAAIQNRSDLMGLVKQYQDHIKALAESGMSSKDLQRETETLRKDFIRQATQMGFNRSELKKYEKGFDDIRVAIRNVPRNITVNANTNPAQQALNEWIAKANKRKASLSVDAKVSAPKSLGSIKGGQYRPSSIYSSGPASVSKITSRNASQLVFGGGGGGARSSMQMISTGGMADPSKVLYRASGGPAEWAKMYARGTDTIPAMLTPGEYVLQKKAVDFYGPQVMQALNNMKVPRQFFTAQTQGTVQAAGVSGGQRVMVDLSPTSIQAVANAVRPQLQIGDKVIAGANSSANRQSTNVGAR